MALSVHESIVT